MVEGVERLIEWERSRLRGDPEQEMRALSRQMRALEGQRQLDEAKEAVLREMDLCENRGEMLRKLVAYRDLLGKRADAWATTSRSSPTYRNTS